MVLRNFTVFWTSIYGLCLVLYQPSRRVVGSRQRPDERLGECAGGGGRLAALSAFRWPDGQCSEGRRRPCTLHARARWIPTCRPPGSSEGRRWGGVRGKDEGGANSAPAGAGAAAGWVEKSIIAKHVLVLVPSRVHLHCWNLMKCLHHSVTWLPY